MLFLKVSYGTYKTDTKNNFVITFYLFPQRKKKKEILDSYKICNEDTKK
jgi:hypothetical protein